MIGSFGAEMAGVALADHRALATAREVPWLLAIPVLWMLGVVALIAFKLRSR